MSNETETDKEVNRQMRLSSELVARAADAAQKTGLSQNDVMKQAMRIGLPLVVKALSLTGEQLANIPDAEPEAGLAMAG